MKSYVICEIKGASREDTFEHPEIGYNFRVTDIQMAVGLAQLKKMDTIISLKNKIYKTYLHELQKVDEITLMKPQKEVNPFIPFRVTLLTKDKSCALMSHMKQHKIETRTFFYPLHKQPCFENIYGGYNLANSLYAYEHGVCLPSYPLLSEKAILYVCKIIKEYYRRGKKE